LLETEKKFISTFVKKLQMETVILMPKQSTIQKWLFVWIKHNTQ